MKNYFLKVVLFISFISLNASKVVAQVQDERKLIIGSWNTANGIIKYVFTSAMKCNYYYKGKLSNSYRYKISNHSIQCGEKVYIDKETSYLELTNLKDGERNCFEINGIGKKTLSLQHWDTLLQYYSKGK